MFKRLYTPIIAIIAFIAVIFYLNGCSDKINTPSQADNVSFSYMAKSDTVDHVGILVLDTVKLLLKDIKLNVSSSSDSTNFKTGPYVIYLDLMSSLVTTVGSAYIPPGTYDKVQFEVHKLNTNEVVPDPEFNDGNNTYSVIAKGSYNGIRFVFKSDQSAKQKLNFPNSLIVTTTMSNITLSVQPYIWFIDTNTSLYLDPNDPNNHNTIDNNIKDNIKANFKAFKDDDKNGLPD